MAKTITCNNLQSSFLGGVNSIIGLKSPQSLQVPKKMKMKLCAQNLKGLNKSSAASSMGRKEVKAMASASSALLMKPAAEASSAMATPTPPKEKKMKKEKRQKKEGGRVDSANGKYGRFGGKFVPETLMTWLTILEAEFNLALHDSHFQEELSTVLRDYVGRETPLYHAERLTSYYKAKNGGLGPEIYLKREDLSHCGAHKINNAIGQAMLAKRIGKTKIVAATGAGQHGVASAAACAKLGLECTVFMATSDMERQSSNVVLMKLLGAQVVPVNGSFKDASSDAFRATLVDFESNYYLQGSVIGPHPCPMIVREFQSVIGKEVRKQAMESWGSKPDVLVACVGGGSNALGLFYEFVEDKHVRLIGVEAGGAATLTQGSVGVYHGAMSYLLQDDEGQILEPHSIGAGLECPGVGPELSYLKDMERAEFHAVTDEDALKAFKRLCKLEGIVPALESAHALAYLDELCPTLPDATKVVVNLSGRGDKDAMTVFRSDLMEQWITTYGYSV